MLKVSNIRGFLATLQAIKPSSPKQVGQFPCTSLQSAKILTKSQQSHRSAFTCSCARSYCLQRGCGSSGKTTPSPCRAHCSWVDRFATNPSLRWRLNPQGCSACIDSPKESGIQTSRSPVLLSRDFTNPIQSHHGDSPPIMETVRAGLCRVRLPLGTQAVWPAIHRPAGHHLRVPIQP